MTASPPPTRAWSAPIRPADLPAGGTREIALRPDAPARAALAEALGINAVRKLSFTGRLLPEGQKDWRLEARLGATVVQPCVVTLAPVTTRIDEDVIRRYLAEMPDLPQSAEVEMPEDDSAEPLPEVLDAGAVMAEALALALPAYPRAPEADLGEAVFTEPGKAPMTDADARPFAGLAALKDKLEKPDGES